MAAKILAKYVADDPESVAELLMESGPATCASFFQFAERHSEKTVPIFRSELEKKITPSWDDSRLDPGVPDADPSVTGAIESAHGLIDPRYAFCQTMRLAEFADVAERLRRSGYRPTRLRPYTDRSSVRVAAVWTRDKRNWRVEFDKSSTEILERDGRNRKDAFVPVDVAGYAAIDGHGKPVDRYAALWVEQTDSAGDVHMYVAKTADDLANIVEALDADDFVPKILQGMHATGGGLKYCGIWAQTVPGSATGRIDRGLFEADFSALRKRRIDQAVVDVSIYDASDRRSIRERSVDEVARAVEILKARPNDFDAKSKRAIAHLRLDEGVKAIDELSSLSGAKRFDTEVLPYLAIARARLGRKDEAIADLQRYQRAYTPAHSRLFLAAVVAAELGDRLAEAINGIEEAVESRGDDIDLRYEQALRSCPRLARGHQAKSCGRSTAHRSLDPNAENSIGRPPGQLWPSRRRPGAGSNSRRTGLR